ncbi:protein adenylyltransferase SelO [Aquihabitans sp. McL0605]|uniref:protein adenylyltransferase SelO n=1 Tax=Aquihabitans sp. McL0605 TaxID=3415671 RepID=UPI003CEA0CF9
MVDADDRPLFELTHRFADELPELCMAWTGATVPDPQVLVVDDELAKELGIDPADLRTSAAAQVLVGSLVLPGSEPVAMGYAGHQFGGYSPRLGDGRALLLGELHDTDGRELDLHLKGSGRTPFSRGGDGKAAIGPMLREHVVSRAMHALGIATTRSLAVTTTGEDVRRDEGLLPGAVLARVAASHLRVGTFQYAAAMDDPALVRRLADHAIARHHPAAARAEQPYLALYQAVSDAQAALVAQWMLVGFIHGVMNTDNTTISGETIDYGPCAFMDAFDPATVFSSIDHGGRYAFGNQPQIVQWNLARLAEALLPLLADDQDEAIALATEVLNSFPEHYVAAWSAGMRTKLGLIDEHDDDTQLFDDLLRLLHEQQVDHTSALRSLSASVRGDAEPARSLFRDPGAFDAWSARHLARVDDASADRGAVASHMDRVNPIYIPRNHLVDEALAAATTGDLAPFERLVDVISQPYDERPGLERYAQPAPAGFGDGFQTFCGT